MRQNMTTQFLQISKTGMDFGTLYQKMENTWREKRESRHEMDLKSPVHSAGLALDVPCLPQTSGFPPPLMTPDSPPSSPPVKVRHKVIQKSRLIRWAEPRMRLNPHCLAREAKAKPTDPPCSSLGRYAATYGSHAQRSP